jgi:long-chain fatty acid transport protein
VDEVIAFLTHLQGYGFFIGILLFCWTEKGWTEAFEAPGLGTRAYSLGGAFIGLADDWSAIFWNPAGLARQEGLNFGINLFIPRFNDYDGNSVHNFDPDNFSLRQGDIFPRIFATEPARFNEKWSKGNSAINPSLALVLGKDKGWAFAAGIYFPLGNLLSWDDLVTDPITQASIRVDYQTFMAITSMNFSLAKEIIRGLYIGLGTNLVYTKFKLGAKKYYIGSVDPPYPGLSL